MSTAKPILVFTTLCSPIKVFNKKVYPIYELVGSDSQDFDTESEYNIYNMLESDGITNTNDAMIDRTIMTIEVNDLTEARLNCVQGEMIEQQQFQFEREYSDSTVVSNSNEHDPEINMEDYIDSVNNNMDVEYPIENMDWHTSIEFGKYSTYDVLLGKGAHNVHHIGNQLYLQDAKQLSDRYRNTTRHVDKHRLQKELIQYVYERNGRFMEKVKDILYGQKIEYWVEYHNYKKLYEKAGQALREAK